MEQKELSHSTPEVSRSRRNRARQFIGKLFKRNQANTGVEYEDVGVDIFSQHPHVAKGSPAAEDMIPQILALPKREASQALSQRVSGNSPEGFGLKLTGNIAEAPADAAANHYDPSNLNRMSERYKERNIQQNRIDELAAKRAEIASDPLRREITVSPTDPTPMAEAVQAFKVDPLGAPRVGVPEAPDAVYQKMIGEQPVKSA